MNIFEILGPVMIGPSSSHTAGAVRIGNTALKLLHEPLKEVVITLSGSFAQTGKGHGTDCALIAGLLGMRPDDERIPDSFEVAKERGLKFCFINKDLKNAHPNTALIQMTGANGRQLDVVGESVGGGKINISAVDGIRISFSGEYNTLIIRNKDIPGNVVLVSTELAKLGINIANMQLYRNIDKTFAVMVIECDQPIGEEVADELLKHDSIVRITIFNKEEN